MNSKDYGLLFYVFFGCVLWWYFGTLPYDAFMTLVMWTLIVGYAFAAFLIVLLGFDTMKAA